ncbi:MAG: dTMP kinase [Candidatus Methanoperedenaceae archaeon HGW-Methanoperedenaceae-1]|nr:MAG: dTMP kinase [Candidatus Methanoperedenaceae archaeon HGW-Methanoperedenaceae-1]
MLVTLEGIDGTGKSSAVKGLESKFKDAVFTREPTHNWIGEAVKKSIESDTDPLAELFLFVADHAEHIARVIKPALLEGKMVISDRYSDSRYAYQGVTLSGLFDDAMEWIKGVHKGWTIVPDLTILFKIDPAVAVGRCGNRGNHTKFEKTEFLRKVQDNFLKLAGEEPDRFVVVDAEQSQEAVLADVVRAIENYIDS